MFGSSPLGWLADLALVAAPGLTPDPVHIVVAAGSLSIGLPVMFAFAIVCSEWLWYVDPVQPDQTKRERSASTARVSDRVFSGVVPRPTLQVAQKSWRRALRAPLNLQYVLFPLFFAYIPLRGIFESGTVPPTTPVVIAIYGAWMTGAAFTLNPFGDEGAALPLTLISSVTGRRFVNGLVLAGVALGAPFTALVTLATGIVGQLSAIEALGVSALSVVLCVGAAMVAAGVGTEFPKFEKSRLSRNRRAVVPSLSAFAVYSVALVLIGLPGLLSQFDLLMQGLTGIVGASQVVLFVAGPIVTVLLAIAGAVLGYQRAVRTFCSV